MCGKRLRIFFVLLCLFSLSCFSPLCFSCYGEVKLTDKEAEEILSEIQESRKELEDVRTELQDVKSTYEEQKKSYEMQLTEAKEKNQTLKGALVATSTSSVVMLIFTVLVLIL